MKYLEWRNRMAFIICIAALIIMMFVFTKMLLSFGNNSSAAVESVDVIIPGLFEPPVRTLRATIPENGSHIFR